MDVKKVAFISATWLIFGFAALSGTAFAAEPPASNPAASQPAAHDPAAHDMSAHGGDQPGGMKCGMMGEQGADMMCDHKGGMMCGQMGGMKCGQMGGMKCGQMGGQGAGMMCDHKGGMMGSHKGGMMGGHGAGMMMGPSRLHMVMSLELNDEQRSKINKLSDELKRNDLATKGKILDESAKLRDLYAADKRNPSNIGKAYQKIFDLQRKMIEATIATQNRIEELLTPEQRTQLKNMRHKPGPMHDHPMQ